jgi:hypothetical protein
MRRRAQIPNLAGSRRRAKCIKLGNETRPDCNPLQQGCPGQAFVAFPQAEINDETKDQAPFGGIALHTCPVLQRTVAIRA